MGVTQSACGNTRTCSVLCVGLDNAGKSTVLSHLHNNAGARGGDGGAGAGAAARRKEARILPTPGMQLEAFSKFRVDWKVWDCSGTGPNRALWRLFYQHVGGVVFVVDSSDRERVSCARDELDALLAAPEFRKRSVSLLVLLNKSDVEDESQMSQAELEMVLQLGRVRVQQRNVAVHVQPCSGIMGTGIEEGFRWLSDSMSSSG